MLASKFRHYLVFVVFILVSFSVYVGYSNFLKDKDTDYYKFKLGLDLIGGISILLEIDQKTIKADYFTDLRESVSSILNTDFKDVEVNMIEGKVGGFIKLVFFDDKSLKKFVSQIMLVDSRLKLKQNENSLLVYPTERSYKFYKKNIMQRTIDVISRRLDQLGTSNISVQRQGDKFILLQFPGANDIDAIKNIIGKTARLSFHFVVENGREAKGGVVYLPLENSEEKIPVDRKAEITGKNLKTASVVLQDNSPIISFRLDSDGASKFASITAQNVGSSLAIVLDGQVISAPRISAPIPSGSGVITGRFSPEEARELALMLKAGSLPVDLKIAQEKIVGPTLGSDTVKSGAFAMILGIILVFIYMVIGYKKIGFIANLTLIFNLLLVMALMSFFGITLNLPGIAGLVLTMGMAVDANILVYERYFQELKKTSSHVNAMSIAFSRVFGTLIDSNLTTIIMAMLLLQFSTGMVQGFAITLMIGIAASIFSTMVVSRVLLQLLWVKRVRDK